jgi:transmembrane sensor
MSAKSTHETIRKATVLQAAEWHVRNAEGELTPEEKVQFLTWLRESPANIQQYLLNADMIQNLPQVLQGRPIDYRVALENVVPLDGPHHDRLPKDKPVSRRRWNLSGSLAAVLCVVTACSTLFLYLNREASRISVAHGDQRTVRLTDGSVIHLNSQSQIRVRLSNKERLIELEAGQALFNVAPDRQRPFRVRAGSTDVVAVGTQFDVYRKSTDITVTVVEGKVQVVDRREGASNAVGAAAPMGAIPLVAGERIKLAGGNTSSRPESVDPREVTAWTRREISFHGRPLGDVAEEYARYLDVPIVIEDEILRRTPVTGMFDAYEPEPFLGFLRSFEGVQIEEDSSAIRVRVDRSKK